MRSLAAFVDGRKPEVLAVCEIDAGDAFALATRFACEWAYRGSQALFWTETFSARAVHDLYLPFMPARPFDRRGLLRVDGAWDDTALSLFATQFASERDAFVPELRFARGQVRSVARRALIFAQTTLPRVAFGGDCVEIARSETDGLHVFARGLHASSIDVFPAADGIGAAVSTRVQSSVRV